MKDKKFSKQYFGDITDLNDQKELIICYLVQAN